ncbi:hypothetical protein ENU1_156150, partial [Entamoeba nuttalli P19]
PLQVDRLQQFHILLLLLHPLLRLRTLHLRIHILLHILRS